MKRTSPDKARNDIFDHLLDEHLAGDAEQLTPSSGFAISVMESIEAQAAELPPIAFPWQRTLPGLLVILCAIVALVFATLHTAGGPVVEFGTQLASFLTDAVSPSEAAVAWALVAACLSIAATIVSFRMTRRSR